MTASKPDATPRTRRSSTTHWEGCEQAHHDCALAHLERLKRELSAANSMLKECRAFMDSTGHRGVKEGCPTCDLMKRVDALTQLEAK